MKKLIISCVGMMILGSLIGCTQKENMSNDILKQDIKIMEENDLLQSDNLDDFSSSEDTPNDTKEYTANLKSIGNDIFEFDTVDVTEIYFENNGESLLKWDIKKADTDESIISGELEAGKKISPEEYLLEVGRYKLSVDNEYESAVDLYIEVNQLD